jgi:hypothetical protein
MSIVNCPSCKQELELDDSYRDWTVRCPHCDREFVPGKQGRPRRDEPDEEDEEDEYEEERDEYVYGYQGTHREEAQAMVSGPGLAMEICGWIGVVLTALGGLLMVIGVMSDRRNADTEGLLIMGCCLGVFLLPYSLVMAIGGRHMRNLSSRGWAMTAAILGVLAIPLMGCGGIIHGALGIWALVVLEKPQVRRAFGLPGRHRRQWD